MTGNHPCGRQKKGGKAPFLPIDPGSDSTHSAKPFGLMGRHLLFMLQLTVFDNAHTGEWVTNGQVFARVNKAGLCTA